MQIYITRNGLQLGPYDEEKLAKLLRVGAVTYDSLAWVEGMTDWQPLRQISPPPEDHVEPGSHTGFSPFLEEI